jgi:3-phosphoshikimate 1-carboxyvinyltransferase
MQRYRGRELMIEPDASGACYFWAAAALGAGRVRVGGLSRGSAQGDVHFVDVLADMGCSVSDDAGGIQVAGPSPGALRGVDVDLNDMPDTAQTLAVLALFAAGPTRIRNVGNLRAKETDRIAALACELRKFGATVEEAEDGLSIAPAAQAPPVAPEIDTYGDHRMAMSFALAGLRAPGVVIRDADCVSKSLPGFFDLFAQVAGGADD